MSINHLQPNSQTQRSPSRDPIGYRGGINLFANYFLIVRLDPLGKRTYLQGDSPKKLVPDKKIPPVMPGDPPAGPACVHNIPGKKRCFFALFSNDDIDDIFEDMGSGGVLDDVAPFQKGLHHATPEGKKKILDAIKTRGCCEVIFAGHQGGKDNPGGICSKSPSTGAPIPLFPDEEFEKELAAIFRQNCPSGCDVFQYSCAGRVPVDEMPDKRKKIAENLGCTFWAVDPGVSPPIRKRKPRPPAGQGRYCSFDPTEWQPDAEKPGWCVPFPMVPYSPAFSE